MPVYAREHNLMCVFGNVIFKHIGHLREVKVTSNDHGQMRAQASPKICQKSFKKFEISRDYSRGNTYIVDWALFGSNCRITKVVHSVV